jgi:hypothetical protein
VSSDDDTGDITSPIKRIKLIADQVKEDQIRAEYEAKDQERLSKVVYSTRERVLRLETRLAKIEWFIAASKWAGGPIVLGLVAKAFLEMIGG